MNIKIGDMVIDTGDEPVMLVLSDQDKEDIKNMLPRSTKYARFPVNWGSEEEMLEWMDDDRLGNG